MIIIHIVDHNNINFIIYSDIVILLMDYILQTQANKLSINTDVIFELTLIELNYILYQLQDLIVTMHVIDQFKHFLYQMKGENLRI